MLKTKYLSVFGFDDFSAEEIDLQVEQFCLNFVSKFIKNVQVLISCFRLFVRVLGIRYWFSVILEIRVLDLRDTRNLRAVWLLVG